MADEKTAERGDLDDPRKVGRKAVLDKIKYRQEKEDVMFVLSSPQGRRFFWRLMKQCGLFKSSWSAEPGRIQFYEGQRNIGLFLSTEMNEVYPEAYLLMVQEEKKNEQAEKT